MRARFRALKHTWKLIVLISLVILVFCYAMFQGGFVSWFLFYSFLPFAVYSLAIAFYPMMNMELQRLLPKQEYVAGEPLRVRIVLRRETSFPLFYLLAEEDLSGSFRNAVLKQDNKALLFPGFKKEIIFDYAIHELPRGEHYFRSIKLKTGDLLGLIEKEKKADSEDKILVYPSYTEMIYRPFENHFDQGMAASRERVQRDTTMAIGVRDYQPGDRFSWINWKASAKRNDLMTKEFEQRQSHDVLIVMDCAPEQRFETIVSFTASIARAILKKGAQAGLLTVSKERTSFPIRSGEAQLQLFFYHLAKIQPVCTVTMDKVLEAEPFYSGQNVTIMLVTSNLTKALIERAGHLGQKKGKVTVFLIKNERELPTNEERALKAMGIARGVSIVLVHENQFDSAFSEVSMQ
ncbi:DUF58 domain-containing protein [Neobacillus notoginsengisoli]|uniref:DUF58 domain-containing protein n=1 Tax=Neobacillus notoginsengisoli TaxID=1578198 RepID=A0A417YFK0_9BACI|nr:DUF58 domain-containing protein [Neobacillus notoginsengisoli]RHW31477.1 DUF58 domain-containing protein [Neobacillus notoginsengisoli]